MKEDSFLPPHGNYRELLSFQKAEIVYDITYRFAHKFLAKGDRTIDQMIQSARSGKQNILEGCKAAVTSKETEIKLTGVARASMEELLADYRDFLRVRDLVIWEKDSKEARFVRRLGGKSPQTFEDYREFVETRPPAVVANIAICLIHQTNYLLDRQFSRLQKDFIREGGLRERMTRARVEYRNRSYGKTPNDPYPAWSWPGAGRSPARRQNSALSGRKGIAHDNAMGNAGRMFRALKGRDGAVWFMTPPMIRERD